MNLVATILVVAMGVLGIVGIIDLIRIAWTARDDIPLEAEKSKEIPHGVIAYKKADITDLEIIDPLQRTIRVQLEGLNGIPYSCDDTATSIDRYGLGFHAYRDFQQAYNHEQTGGVMLEVMLSGHVYVHEKGYRGEHQRVLQILIDPQMSTLDSLVIDSGQEPSVREFAGLFNSAASRRRLLHSLSLCGEPWTDQHGNRIVFAPTHAMKHGRTTCGAFVPTRLPQSEPAAA